MPDPWLVLTDGQMALIGASAAIEFKKQNPDWSEDQIMSQKLVAQPYPEATRTVGQLREKAPVVFDDARTNGVNLAVVTSLAAAGINFSDPMFCRSLLDKIRGTAGEQPSGAEAGNIYLNKSLIMNTMVDFLGKTFHLATLLAMYGICNRQGYGSQWEGTQYRVVSAPGAPEPDPQSVNRIDFDYSSLQVTEEGAQIIAFTAIGLLGIGLIALCIINPPIGFGVAGLAAGAGLLILVMPNATEPPRYDGLLING